MAEQMIQNISGITGGGAQVHVRRVVCLYRVSSVGQVEKDDIPMQKQSCREFVQRQTGWEIVKEFSEKGVSGFKKSAKDRDAIQEIQKLALQGGFDILLVFMFDRLGRRDDETPFVVEWFVKQNIEVWSAMEGQQRFDNHVDKLLNYIRYWQASGESIKTSMRVKTRIEQLTQEGHFTGGRAPFGYRAEKTGRMNKKNQDVRDLVIDPEDAEIVKLIFQKYVYEGYGALRLCRYFREQGIRRRDGGEVTVGMINRAVKNSIYIGVIHRGDSKSEVLPDLKVIDEELSQIQKAPPQALLAKQRSREVDLAKMKAKRLNDEYEQKQRAYQDLRAETLKVIQGSSRFSANLLNSLMDETAAQLKELESQMQTAELEVREAVSGAEQVEKEYTQLMNWAELYDNWSLEAKKMIVAQFVKAVRVKRGYELDIEFNVSFEEFQALYLEPEEKGRKRKRAGEILALAECAG